MRRRNRQWIFDAVVIVSLIAATALTFWIWTSAPCGLWSFATTGDTPARCLMHR